MAGRAELTFLDQRQERVILRDVVIIERAEEQLIAILVLREGTADIL